MHVPLNFISVIMVLRFVVGSDDITDLSDSCSRGRDVHYYLTSGAGSSDKLVAMIATEEQINCTLLFSAKAGHYIMLVLEFPDKRPQERVCYAEHRASVMVRDDDEKEECNKSSVKDPFRSLSKEKMSVRFRSGGDLSTVKITATSMRDSSEVRCSKNSEIECVYGEQIFCMTPQCLCDGHNNCGVPDFYDEDDGKCKGPSLSFFCILCSLIMVLLTLFLLLSIVMCLVPRRRDPYVHNFDQDMSLFDCENGIETMDINIIVLFP